MLSEMIEEGLPPDQYIKDEYFQKWVYRPDRDCDLYWQEFLRSNPSQQVAIEEARIFLRIFNNHADDIGEERVNEVIKRIAKSVDVLEAKAGPDANPIMRIESEPQAAPTGWRHRVVSAFNRWLKP